jgi:hypothetical protein
MIMQATRREDQIRFEQAQHGDGRRTSRRHQRRATDLY